MARTFGQMASEANGRLPAVSASELKQQLERDPELLLVDVRDFDSRAAD